MKIKVGIIDGVTSDKQKEYLRSEIDSGYLQLYIRSRMKAMIPVDRTDNDEFTLTFSTDEKDHTAYCYLKGCDGTVIQVEQSSRDLYKAVDSVVNKMTSRIKQERIGA